VKPMVTRILCALLLAACAGAGLAAPPPMTVTYVGTTGFLVECAGHKVAIDALLGGWKSEAYDIPSDSVVALMTGGRPPFDGIEVIAVTHRHEDHFGAEIVAAYLEANPRCVLLCPPQIAEEMARQRGYAAIRRRIHAVDAPVDSVTAYSREGIEARILTSRHNSYYETDPSGKSIDRHRLVQHLEFLFTIGGRSFLHVGDAPILDRNKYLPLGLGKDPIDLAFVQAWGCYQRGTFTESIVRESIRPKRIFFTHLPRGRAAGLAAQSDCPSFRQVTFPTRSLESWDIP
jgi:L-ascorbate metabolism protein UlaG (beta-lactamase superfamily)